jgi:hypothetical protein
MTRRRAGRERRAPGPTTLGAATDNSGDDFGTRRADRRVGRGDRRRIGIGEILGGIGRCGAAAPLRTGSCSPRSPTARLSTNPA